MLSQNGSLPPTCARYGVLGFTLALTAVAYLDRVCISTAAPAMKAGLNLSDAQMGYVFSAFTFAYALMEIPSGWLADRFGPRLMLARIVIWWSVMTANGLGGGIRVAVSDSDVVRHRRSGMLSLHDAGVCAMAARERARTSVRIGGDDGRVWRGTDAAAGGVDAGANAMAAYVPGVRSGRPGVGGGVVLVVSR